MAWDFSTDPEFEKELEWMRTFVAEEVEPLDLVFRQPEAHVDPRSSAAKAMAPLKEEVKRRGLWACHLGPELGGKGFGQLKLGLMNEILGRSRFAPTVFGTQAPDTGNAEILARFGIPSCTGYVSVDLAVPVATLYPTAAKVRFELNIDHIVEIGRGTALSQLVRYPLHLLIRHKCTMDADREPRPRRKKEHIAMTQQAFGTALVENGARIDPRGDLERHP